MKIRIGMKTPDALLYAFDQLSDDERAEAETAAAKFFEYEECVTLELDTKTGACEVVPL